MTRLSGREAERGMLRQIADSTVPELAVVTGRLDVGKTTLVRQCLGDHLRFHLTGTANATLSQQLDSFAAALTAARGDALPPPAPASWAAAFEQLTEFLDTLGSERKLAVFFDELPWLASRRSKFLPALEQFWLGWAARRPHVAVVISGSAGAAIRERILAPATALSTHITRQIHCPPLNLQQTQQYLADRGVQWSRQQTLDIYMALGGIPSYLNEVRPGRTAAQTIDEICFSSGGLLNGAFPRLLQSLFEHPTRRLRIVQAMVDRRSALQRDEIRKFADFATGGNLTVMLDELLGAGLVDRTIPWQRTSKDAMYRVADPYTLFYLNWIDRNRTTGRNIWTRKLENPSWRTWCDYAFESVCLQHAEQLKRALGVESAEFELCSWRHRTVRKSGSENDISMVFHGAPRRIYLIEPRYCLKDLQIDKNYAAQVRGRREAFRRGTKTKRPLLLTLVSTHPVKPSRHRESLIDVELGLDALFS